jgi:transcriptional regulator with XRE-family HTH domain
MEGFAQRLQKVLDHHGITAYKLGKDIDFSNAAIGNMLAGKTNPSFEFLSRLMELFPMLNANWLVMGRGEMFIDDSIRSKGFRSHPPDLLEAKAEIIRLLNENMRMKDEKILRLTEELKNQKGAGIETAKREAVVDE